VQAGVEVYYCPSRRSATELSKSEANGETVGSVADYAGNAGSTAFWGVGPDGLPGTDDDDNTWAVFDLPVDGVINSGFAVDNPVSGGRLVGKPRGRYNFTHLKDGLSHTILVGEKSVNRENYGQPGGWADGCIYNGNEPGTFMRLGGVGIPLDCGDDVELLPGAVPSFGSVHGGLCNFVFADGHTTSIAESIEEQTLGLLCARNDGQVVPEF
jgi:prepilin-type processing-associated H-X9-DG protein